MAGLDAAIEEMEAKRATSRAQYRAGPYARAAGPADRGRCRCIRCRGTGQPRQAQGRPRLDGFFPPTYDPYYGRAPSQYRPTSPEVARIAAGLAGNSSARRPAMGSVGERGGPQPAGRRALLAIQPRRRASAGSRQVPDGHRHRLRGGRTPPWRTHSPSTRSTSFVGPSRASVARCSRAASTPAVGAVRSGSSCQYRGTSSTTTSSRLALQVDVPRVPGCRTARSTPPAS